MPSDKTPTPDDEWPQEQVSETPEALPDNPAENQLESPATTEPDPGPDPIAEAQEETVTEDSSAKAAAHEAPLAYDGKPGQLLKMGLMVTLLTGITGGIYMFWGKTRIRRYLWGHLTLLGDRISYTGTGKELFLGFLIVLAVLTPVFLGLGGIQYLLQPRGPVLKGLFITIVYCLSLLLIGYAVYRARQYRLSRTVWRGIRFGQTGSAARYAISFLGWSLANIMTLGLIMPVFAIKLTRFEILNTWLGNRHLVFEGRAGEIYKTWLLCWIALPFTLGLSYIWFLIYLNGYIVSRTRFEGLGFNLPIRLRESKKILFAIFLINLGYMIPYVLLAVVVARSGPQGAPHWLVLSIVGFLLFFMFFARALVLRFVTHPYLALIASRFEMSGTAEFDSITQNMETRSTTGEGLAAALDVGAGLDAGL